MQRWPLRTRANFAVEHRGRARRLAPPAPTSASYNSTICSSFTTFTSFWSSACCGWSDSSLAAGALSNVIRPRGFDGQDGIGQRIHQRLQSASLLLKIGKLFVSLGGKLIKIPGHSLNGVDLRVVERARPTRRAPFERRRSSNWLTGSNQPRRRINSPARTTINDAPTA